MKFKMVHQNYNVKDLEKSIKFYNQALGLLEKRRVNSADGSFILVYLGDEENDFLIELTWIRDMKKNYNLGDNEFHLAFETDNYQEAYNKHKEMECICFENKEMGIYFIQDPDGYWLEIIPSKNK